jgi:hypothetical protein
MNKLTKHFVRSNDRIEVLEMLYAALQREFSEANVPTNLHNLAVEINFALEREKYPKEWDVKFDYTMNVR